jgi:hypothetical protein
VRVGWTGRLLSLPAPLRRRYYFLKVVHPAAGGVSLLDTPVWL